MSETLAYLEMLAKFPFRLRGFLRQPLTLDKARSIILRRMDQREELFLQIAETSIYGYPRSPYLPLLKLAGCELGDLRQLVGSKGLEGALAHLRNSGVYFSFEEFKGRAPVVRNGQTLAIRPDDFNNPYARNSLAAESGGSTGPSTRVAMDLDQLAARAPHKMATEAAHGILGAPTVIWRGIMPDSTLNTMLQRAYMRDLPRRWFSHIALRDSKHWIKYGLATYYILLWMRLYRIPIPLPSFVMPNQPLIVAAAVAELAKAHALCCVEAVVSRSLRLCLAANEAGISFKGVVVKCGGEPVTPAKVKVIESTGARYFPHYALTEAGALGSGCVAPAGHDDVHLFKDAFAIVSHDHRVDGFDVVVPAFNLTTLLPTAPKILLNLQMDDYGVIEERACRCPFEDYGYTTHLRQIRSYRKLTGEGVTLVGSDMLRILEEVLPGRFGGSPLDYQLLEEEDGQGFTRLYLVIDPSIRIDDERAVIDDVLDALRRSGAMADAARSVWQRNDSIKIRRMKPVWTARGKMMPLHLERTGSQSQSHPEEKT